MTRQPHRHRSRPRGMPLPRLDRSGEHRDGRDSTREKNHTKEETGTEDCRQHPRQQWSADAAATPSAKEKEELEHLRDTTLNLIKLLVQEGVVSQEKADALVRAAERSAITPAEVKPAPEKIAAAPAADSASRGRQPSPAQRPSLRPTAKSCAYRTCPRS